MIILAFMPQSMGAISTETRGQETGGGWNSYSFDLSNVYVLGNLCGERQVWIAFHFDSDYSYHYEGTYLDDMVLKKEGKAWTIAVYLAADNTLGGAPAFADFDEIEKALMTSGNDVNVIVLWDDTTNPDTTLYWVQPDSTEGSHATYTKDITYWNVPAGWAFAYPAGCPTGYPTGSATSTELDMGTQSTLTDFLDWVFRNFQSDYYGLILWNHGGGWEPKKTVTPVRVEALLENGAVWEQTFWPRGEELAKKPILERAPRQAPLDRGICWDDTSGTYLDTKEVAYGIDNSTGGWVDNLGFDACLMQMLEVAYEIRDTPNVAADYITASQETEWGWGWAYHQILSGITSATTPYQLAVTWGTTRTRWQSGGLDTISSIDVWRVDDLANAVTALANRLSTLLSSFVDYHCILLSKLQSSCFAYNEYIDLEDFCRWIRVWFDSMGDTTTRDLADAVCTEIGTAVVVAQSTAPGYFGASGISIYMPHYHDVQWMASRGASHASYNSTNFAFCNDHTWDDFLTNWLAADHPDPHESNDTPSTAYNRGTCSPNWLYFTFESDFDDLTDDWYKFTVPYPSYITVWAWCTERNSDTVMYLYDSLADAQADNWFAMDDDGIYWTLGRDNMGSYYSASSKLDAGTYYVKVVPYTSYGTLRDYQLWIQTSRAPTPAVFRVESSGNVLADGPFYGAGFHTGSADVAEWVPVSEPVESGDVLELDPDNPGCYRKSRGPCSTLVAGVVSTDPGVVLGADTPSSSASGFGPWTMDFGPWTSDSAFLALIGIVPVKVTDEGGPIQPGDLLVTSSTPGHAMRWDPQSGEACNFVGKALERLERGTGVILVLLMH
jgi:hypothetical protein